MYDVLGDPQKALESFTPALDIFRSFSDAREQGRVLNNIGKLEAVRANFQGALDYYRQASGLLGPDPDPGVQAFLLHNMAVIYETLGDFPQAISLFEQALPLRRKTGDQRGEADTLTSLGFTYFRAEQNEAALRSYEQSLALRLQLGDKRGESLTRSYMSITYARLGRFVEARENHAKAIEYAAAAKDRRFEAQAWLRAAGAYEAEGDAAQSVEAATRALEGFRALDDRPGQANALQRLARSENNRNHLDKARHYIEEAVRLVESNRSGSASQQLRASYFATNQDLYTLYIDVLMRLGDKAGALHVSERSRSRSLLEMLAESGAGIREGVDAALLERELQEVDAEIRRGSPRYAALTRPNPLTAPQIQDLLDEGTLLLEYSLGETRSYLWVVGRNSLETFELPARDAINAQAAHAYDLIVRRADADLPAALQELRRTIFPAGAQLGAKRLVIVADGALQRLPFSALLLDTNETVMLPSASTLHVLRREMAERRRTPPKMLAVFADPVFESTARVSRSAADARILEHLAAETPASGNNATVSRMRIPPLPFTRQEAEEILKAAPAAADKNLRALGYQANRDAATSADLSQYRYLHFATHGYLDAERPGFSALVLSMVDEKGQPRDGFLRVNDIYNLKLAADLVVLSACQTGLGKEIRGEGLMGLTRAFMYAGAPRVVVSLWNVNDRATATLMAGMYRRMLREGKHPATALREAQLEMRKDKRWQSPYYWAAFAQHGEWK
jgi:CHAT domain-containing protein/Tfp pilus assembly protein PilF